MTDCKYQIELPTAGICCRAYFESVREDKRAWMHFPACHEQNCPLVNPELLEGAKLAKDEWTLGE